MKAAKILLSCILAVSVLLTFGQSSSAATSFKDISSSYRAYDEIMYLAQGEIVTGDTAGRFNPNLKVTRAEAVAMIGRALGLSSTQTATNFKDVGANNFASGYIKAAVAKGIVSGYGDGTFRPNNYVTRGEMAVLISKAFNYSFDGTVSSAATALKSRGIAQGLANGSFGTGENIIRADYAVFLARAIDYKLRITPTTSFNSGEKVVNVSSLNVRKGPSTKYATVGSLALNTKVATSYSVGNWTLVKSGSIIGFVSSSYLGTSTSSGSSGSAASGSDLSKLTIVIDPGHGGSDPGAIGYGLQEKTVVLDTGLKLQALLAKTPFKVVMTRTSDTYPTLAERVAIAENAKADSYISIHANAYNGNASGTETWYASSSSKSVSASSDVSAASAASDGKMLATYVQKRLVSALGLTDRGIKETSSLYVVTKTSMPAVLAELGFIDNASDNAKLAQSSYRQKAAQAIYYGILDYYKYKGYDVSKYY
ncbi:MAG: N-acetylmuramoyl-L-alanine amidase [Bacillus sp. (in: firmicutes)]